MSKVTNADGARALGISEDEVAGTADSPAGLVVSTTDGAKYIVVPEDQPDGAGRSGVMYLVPPTIPYRGDFPVYSQPPEEEPAADEAVAVPPGSAKDAPVHSRPRSRA